jgi:delta-aminolevulinic acid dehydratase/porphobilinogen synthase
MDPMIGRIGASVRSSGSAEAKQIAIMSYSVPNSAAKYFGGHADAVGTIISTVTTNCLRGDLLNINICRNVERFTS